MKNLSFPRFLTSCVFGALATLAVTPSQAAPKALQFISGPDYGLGIALNHPYLNGKPTLRLIVTHQLDHLDRIYNNHPIGLDYDTGINQWRLVNEDHTFITENCRFNVLIPQKRITAQATPLTAGANATFFRLQKNNPAAILLFSHIITPYLKVPGIYSTAKQGLYYMARPGFADSNCWSIINEDQATPAATAYTVADVTRDPNAFVVTADAGNSAGNYVTIDHPLINGNPNAVLFINHVANPAGRTPGGYFPQFFGVWYNQDTARWNIFVEDVMTPMPLDTSFNVLALPAPTP